MRLGYKYCEVQYNIQKGQAIVRQGCWGASNCRRKISWTCSSCGKSKIN